MSFIKTTEEDSNYNHLEKMSISEIVENINSEDKTIPLAVEKAIPEIETLIKRIVIKLKSGGRLFYIGAGTSGRLGILDASECPPTFGVPHELVIGLIAGGDKAIRIAVENAEDSIDQGWLDLKQLNISSNDFVIGIAASGTTPYVIGALQECNKNKIETGCITCNLGSPLAITARYPIVVKVGPEFLTGSSRMKSGTAQKLILNMITTASMIRSGRVKGNKMIDIQITNDKLEDRAARILMEELNIDLKTSIRLLEEHKSIRAAIKNHK